MRPSSSASAVSRSPRWVSSSSTCATASSYSCLASGFTGPSCSRRRIRRSTLASSDSRSSSGSASVAGSGSSPRRPASSFRSRSASAAESRTCCADTSAAVTDSLARFRRPWSSASSWAQDLSAAAVSSPAAAPASSSCPRASRRAATDSRCALERLGGTVGVGGEGEVALRAGLEGGQRARALLALAPDALGEPLLGAQVSEQLRPAHGLGAVVGRLAAAGDHPLGATHDLLGLGRLAQRDAKRALGALACRVGLGNRGAVALQCGAGLGLLGDGSLGGGDELVAPAELLEQALGAAGRRLRQLAGAGVEEASCLRDGDGAEASPGSASSDSTTQTPASSRSASAATSRSGRTSCASSCPPGTEGEAGTRRGRRSRPD